jgi:hypothetical protein
MQGKEDVMQWNSILGMALMGGGVCCLSWLTFRLGQALWFRLGLKAALKPERFFIMANQPDYENPVFQPVPDGQERLATQPERDDINEKIERAQLPSTVNNN